MGSVNDLRLRFGTMNRIEDEDENENDDEEERNSTTSFAFFQALTSGLRAALPCV